MMLNVSMLYMNTIFTNFRNYNNTMNFVISLLIWILYRVEDHDDLTPIFNRQSDMLKMTYGDYFLAELIEAQDDHMHCLVAEVVFISFGTEYCFCHCFLIDIKWCIHGNF